MRQTTCPLSFPLIKRVDNNFFLQIYLLLCFVCLLTTRYTHTLIFACLKMHKYAKKTSKKNIKTQESLKTTLHTLRFLLFYYVVCLFFFSYSYPYTIYVLLHLIINPALYSANCFYALLNCIISLGTKKLHRQWKEKRFFTYTIFILIKSHRLTPLKPCSGMWEVKVTNNHI